MKRFELGNFHFKIPKNLQNFSTKNNINIKFNHVEKMIMNVRKKSCKHLATV